VSGADDDCLEFFSVIVPDGEFTTELAAMSAGAVVLVDKTAYGFLTCDRFEKGPDLWLLATGTGLGPFISILKDPQVWQEFTNIVVVHSVREADELAYRDTIEAYARPKRDANHGARLHYVPIVTRAQVEGRLHQRIPAALASGALEAHVGLPLNRERARVMICGNPQMVADTRKCLSERGLAPSRRGAPGQLAVENYW
jgi:ferredoxin--NADP+ reductase